MFYENFIIFLAILYIVCDVNYVFRTLFTVWSSRLWKKQNCNLSEVTSIYGICTFQDCDISFIKLRLARLVRDLDFARYHFYDQTGIYERSRVLDIHSLQGSTLTISLCPIPLFALYKINTKLVYWDERSLFFEHEIVTLGDNTVRSLLVSRQYAIRINHEETTTEILLKDLPGSNNRPICPTYINNWLDSMQITSDKIRRNI